MAVEGLFKQHLVVELIGGGSGNVEKFFTKQILPKVSTKFSSLRVSKMPIEM